MLKWDLEYNKLCKKILTEGIEVENRTANNTIKIPSYSFSLDISEEFPILTTKKLYSRQAILELMWIYLVQSNDVNWLQERRVSIWDEWKIDDEGYWTAKQKIKQPDGSFKIEEVKKYFGKEYAGTIGTAYGYLVNKYHKTEKALDLIMNHPESRRNVVSLWHDEYLNTGVLEPCVWSHEVDVTNGTLNMYVHQRSSDVPLGLPFNVTQYATLMNMYAHVANLKVGTLSWSIKDAHIYVNQVPMIKEQIERAEKILYYEMLRPNVLKKELEFFKYTLTKENLKVEDRRRIELELKAIDYVMNPPKPTLYLNPEVKNFFDFDTSAECKDIKVLNYKDMGPLRIPVSE